MKKPRRGRNAWKGELSKAPSKKVQQFLDQAYQRAPPDTEPRPNFLDELDDDRSDG